MLKGIFRPCVVNLWLNSPEASPIGCAGIPSLELLCEWRVSAVIPSN